MSRIREHASYFSPQVTRTRRFYHTDWRRHVSENGRLHVVGGGREWCAPDFTIDRTSLPYVAFEFVWVGRGTVQLGDECHDLAPGIAFLFDPTIPHVIRSDSTDPLVKYFFNFAGERIRKLLRELKLKAGTVFRIGEAARVAELLDESIDNALKGTALGLRASTSALEHALVLCAEGRRPANPRVDPAYATYLRCRNFMLRQFPLLRSVTDAARECHVSTAYLTRLFQRFDSETPYGCLRRLKLNEALLKLRQPGAQAKAVAVELGYKSAAHFSRAFHDYHGMSPSSAMGATVRKPKPIGRRN